MKKFSILILFVLMMVFLASCSDKKYDDFSIQVIFFTDSSSTKVDPYTDLESGQLIDEPDEPERTGSIFDGWYKDYRLTEPWDFDEDRLGDKSIILYPKWDDAIFDIYYDLNGGTMTQTEYVTTFTTGDSKVLPTGISRTGFTFKAWYLYDWVDETSTKPGDRGYITIPSDYSEDLYLYAHWEPVSVSITFRINYPIDGEGPANINSKVVNYGDVIDFQVLADTNDYIFMGWNSNSSGTGTWYVNGDIFVRTQRITLYAIWQEK